MKDISIYIYLSVFQSPLLSERGGSYRTGTAHMTLSECESIAYPDYADSCYNLETTTY